MAFDRSSRPAPAKTTISECARRYHSCALAFSRSLGIPLAEALRDYHAPITAVFIEASRCGLRLPAGVTLPRLAEAPVAQGTGNTSTVEPVNGQPAGASEPGPMVPIPPNGQPEGEVIGTGLPPAPEQDTP